MLVSLVYLPIFLLLMPDIPNKVKGKDGSEEAESLVTNLDVIA